MDELNIFPYKAKSACTAVRQVPGTFAGVRSRGPPERRAAVPAGENQAMLCHLFDDAKFEGETQRGRQFIHGRTIQNLSGNNTSIFMDKLRENVHTAFYLRHVYSYQLRNIENDDLIVHYTNPSQGSPWFNSLAEAEKWLKNKE